MPTPTFATKLLNWFDVHGRKSLPWQGTRDPYRIWVAEIMLQQTQVVTVIPYYQKFIARFPTISDLAAAPQDQVLHHWSGLGYYARARNLHASAKQIVANHNGVFPDSFAQVRALPGIGRSTAGAILAAAFSQRHAILDGNVKRVLSRYHAIAEPPSAQVENRLWELAIAHTPQTRVADYNQAIMDLGASVCNRATPNCVLCPLKRECKAYAHANPTAYPAPKPKRPRKFKSTIMLLIQNSRGEVLLEKQPSTGIWGDLWSLPQYPDSAAEPRQIADWCAAHLGIRVTLAQPLPRIQHAFTHFTLDILPVPAKCDRARGVGEPAAEYAKSTAATATTSPADFDPNHRRWINPDAPPQIGLPTAVQRVLQLQGRF